MQENKLSLGSQISAIPSDLNLAIATLISNVTGGTAAAADVAAQLKQAAQEIDPVIQSGQRIIASSDITGAGVSTAQMFAEIVGNTAAANFAGALGKGAAGVGLLANAGLIGYTAVKKGPGEIKDSDIVSLFGSVVAAGATAAAPEVAVALGIAAAALTFASLAWSDAPSLQNNIDSLRKIIAPYFNQLSTSDQTAFKSSLSSTIQNAYAGGMAVPKLNDSGLIASYAFEVPSNIEQRGDGTVFYFSSGTTYFQGSSVALKDSIFSNAVSETGTWMIRNGNSAIQAQICTYSDGSWSQDCLGSNGRLDAVYVLGDNQGYTVSGLGGATYINDAGNHNNLNVNSGSSVILSGGGNSVTTGGSSITLNAGLTGSIYGNANTVYSGTASITTLYGLNNVVNLVANSNSQVNLYSTNATTTVSGGGNTIGIFGNNQNVVTTGNTFHFGSVGYTTNLYGGSNVVNALAGCNFGLNGVGYVMNLASASNSLVNLSANSSATVNGYGNTIGICGTGINVAATNNTINLGGTGYSTSLYGGYNIVNATAGCSFGLFGVGFTMNLTPASNSLVNLSSNSSATVNGYGNSIGICGTNTSVASSNNTINMSSAGYTANLYGGNNVVNAAANSSLGLFGAGYVMNLVSSSNTLVSLSANSTAAINGIGNTIGICGTGASVTCSNNTINFGGTGYIANLFGSYNVVNAMAGSSVGLNGIGYVMNLASASNSLVNLSSNSSATVNGFGNTIGICGTGVNVTCSSNTINFGGTGFVTNLFGGYNVVNATSNSSIGLFGGGYTMNLVSRSNSLVNLSGNSSAIVNGSDSTIGICGSGISVAAYGNVVNTIAGASFNLQGGSDTVNLGDRSYLGLLGGSGYSVIAQTSTINTWDNTSFTLSGSGNLLGLGVNSAVAVTGNSNTINAGDHSVILDNGVNNQIHSNNSVITIGRENLNQTIYVYGNGNYIDASALQSSDWRATTTIVVRGTGNTIYSNNTTAVDLHNTSGNNVVGSMVTVYADNISNFTRGGGAAPSGIYGPLNPALPSGTQINFPSYMPDGSSSPSNDPVWFNWGGPDMAWYGMPSSCPKGYFDENGNFVQNICVNSTRMTTSGSDVNTAFDGSSSTQNANEAATVLSMIAAMATYGCDTAATSSLVAPAQNDSQILLISSAH